MKKGHITNPRALQELEQDAKHVREQYDADLKEVLSTAAGRRFFYRVCFDTSRILGPSMTGNSETFYNEGRRAVGLKLWAEGQRVAPADVVQALTDALHAQQKAALALDAMREAPEESDE